MFYQSLPKEKQTHESTFVQMALKTLNRTITLGNKILAHERFIVFVKYLFTLNSNMQSEFFHHPQFLCNDIFYYQFFGILGIFFSDFFIREPIF